MGVISKETVKKTLDKGDYSVFLSLILPAMSGGQYSIEVEMSKVKLIGF